jgi:hypothetical protein
MTKTGEILKQGLVSDLKFCVFRFPFVSDFEYSNFGFFRKK